MNLILGIIIAIIVIVVGYFLFFSKDNKPTEVVTTMP